MDEEALGGRASPPGSGTRRPRGRARPGRGPRRSRRGTATASTQGLDVSVSRYAQVTSTASSEGGPAGRSDARGNRPDGPYCMPAEDAAVVVAVDRAPTRPTRPRRGSFHLPLSDLAVAPALLPPHAAPGRPRAPSRVSARVHPGEPRGHRFDRTTSSVTSGRANSQKGTKVVPRPGETCSVVPETSYTPAT